VTDSQSRFDQGGEQESLSDLEPDVFRQLLPATCAARDYRKEILEELGRWHPTSPTEIAQMVASVPGTDLGARVTRLGIVQEIGA